MNSLAAVSSVDVTQALAYLFWSEVPADGDVVSGVTFGRDKRLEDLANDRTSRIVRVDQVNVIAWTVRTPWK